jgi:hypothetical protein
VQYADAKLRPVKTGSELGYCIGTYVPTEDTDGRIRDTEDPAPEGN